jgi:hypothetical protein
MKLYLSSQTVKNIQKTLMMYDVSYLLLILCHNYFLSCLWQHLC